MWTVATEWIPDDLMPVPETHMLDGWHLESLLWSPEKPDALQASTPQQQKHLRTLVKGALLRAGKSVI